MHCFLNVCILSLFSGIFLQGVEGQQYYIPATWINDEDVAFIPPDISEVKDAQWFGKYGYGLPEVRSNSLFDSKVKELNNSSENEVDAFSKTADVMKRDYTAAQLLKMLKQLARTRGRNRNIRVSGKSLRFGISRK